MPKKLCLYASLMAILFINQSLYAIDCNKAETQDEKTICSHENLKSYDAAMSKIYTATLQTLNEQEKNDYVLNQNNWLKERAKFSDPDQLTNLYIHKIRDQCNQQESVCKNLTLNSIKQWQNNEKKLNNVDEIIISSYFKGNINRYVDDKKELKIIQEDINSASKDITLDSVDLYKIDNQNTLITIPLFMGAYQGQSVSFLNNDDNFQMVGFPQFNGNVEDTYEHSNYIDWINGQLIIHNRSQGYLYECGTTQYYTFHQGAFKLIKQVYAPCTEKEMEAIQNGKLTPENIKREVVYPNKTMKTIKKTIDQDPPNHAVKNSSAEQKESDISNYLTTHKDLQFTFLFPVIDDQVKLKVIIPRDFKALEGDPNAELLEFIPKTDKDPYQWSEIITLNKILGTGITASDYIAKIDDSFLTSVKTAKILEKGHHPYNGYQDAFSIIQYNSGNRNEVVIFYSVSGPLDIANVQYALPLAQEDKIEDLVKKLKEFLKNNVKIVKQ